MTTEQTILCKIRLTKPFAGIAYGIQSGNGSIYITIQRQVADSSDLLFQVALPYKETKDGKFVWYGPIVQGPIGNKFLYIDVGSYAGQSQSLVNGRLKIALPGLSADLIVSAKRGCIFSTMVSGTRDENSKPNFGTVKPVDGWKAIESDSNPLDT